MMNMYEFSNEALRDVAEFEKMEAWFKTQPPEVVKYSRKDSSLGTKAYSYIWYNDPHTDEKIALRIANKQIAGHILGVGSYGKVKLAVDKNGNLYALKIQTEYEPLAPPYMPLNKQTNIFMSEERYGKNVQFIYDQTRSRTLEGPTVKSYTITYYGGPTLSSALTSPKPLSLEEKVSITRRLCWTVEKLHKGYLSQDGKGIIHCDLKPANILYDKYTNKLMLIDYGLAVDADTKGVLYGTYQYTPVLHGLDPFITDVRYANRVRDMGTGLDVFSLKRIIHMPWQILDTPNRSIFGTAEWNTLPDPLKQDIAILDTQQSTDMAVQQIKDNNESALDLAIRFLAYEMSDPKDTFMQNYNKIKNLTLYDQKKLCECAEFVDNINYFGTKHIAPIPMSYLKEIGNIQDIRNDLLHTSCVAMLHYLCDAGELSPSDRIQWEYAIQFIVLDQEFSQIDDLHNQLLSVLMHYPNAKPLATLSAEIKRLTSHSQSTPSPTTTNESLSPSPKKS